MPTLSSKSTEHEALQPQLPSTIAVIQSTHLLAESINEIYLESFRQMFKGIHEIIELQNKELIRAFAAGFSFNNLFPNGIFNLPPSSPAKAASIGIFGEINVVEGEIEKALDETALLPAIIPASPAHKSRMGLKYISGGNFSYKRKTLLGLSLRNREGQLLEMMLKNADLFVSDHEIDRRFYTIDILGRSNLVKLLKNKFKVNKLRAIIKRQGEGYILINIQPLYIN
jgi:hypothetical protein